MIMGCFVRIYMALVHRPGVRVNVISLSFHKVVVQGKPRKSHCLLKQKGHETG